MCAKLRLLLFALAVSKLVLAQTQPPSDPQAVTLAAQSIAALTGGVTITDITLTGTGTWNGTDSGPATMQALGVGESRIDLALSGGTRSEIRDSQTGSALGQWIAPNNTSGAFAMQNCWTDAVWFFPALSSLAAGPNVVLVYVGQESRNGTAVQHIQSYQFLAGQFPSPTPQQLSTIDFYLDASTSLPVAVTFNVHPDNDASTNLPVEIDFSNYQNIGGALVPLHIQRYLQGNPLMDLVVSNATFNTGLTLSAFTIN